MSGRRALLKALASIALASPLAGLAQPAAKNARVAVLEGGFAGSAAAKQFGDAFVQALATLGCKEGVNLHVDQRHAEGKLERLPALAMELAQAKPDVILAPTRLATEAVLKATRTIPVVFANFPDPVKAGAVASLSRPGGNATGFTHITFELTGKRLELLKEVNPRLRRLGAVHTADVTSLDELAELRHIAEGLGIEVIVAEAKNSEAYEDAFALLRQARVDAVFLLTSIANFLNRKISADLALKYRLPTVTELSGYPESGGLMSYGVNLFDLRRKAAGYVDRILRGAKPADLPVQRPTEFELVINLNTAKALGIRIPQSILLRADRVIE